MMPIQRAVDNIIAGVGVLSVDPAVEMRAMSWREALVAGDKETQSEVYALLLEGQRGETEWSFTRQELSQMVTTSRREKEEAEAARAAEAAAEAAETLETAVLLEDGTMARPNLNIIFCSTSAQL